MKRCNKCNTTKPKTEFHKDSSRKCGVYSSCKICKAKYTKANKTMLNASSKRWRENNLEYCRQAGRDYCKKRPDLKNANTAKRRASKKNATLKGFDNELKEVYKQCKTLQLTSDVKLVVDHIIPLTNLNVCGLHVPWNLQIITEQENLQKHNKF